MTINSTIKRGSWLVYFNGIEVPADTATISAAVGTLPQATVTLPPDASMRRIGAEDRVRLTIFYLDVWRGQVDGQGDQFRLLFDGEIVSWNWTNSAQGRALSYTAVDRLEVLGRIFPFFIASLDSLAQDSLAKDKNSKTLSASPFAITNSLFSVGLNSGEYIARPFDFVKNVLDMLGDDTVAFQSDRSTMLSQWFKPWDARTGFSKSFVPSTYVEPSLRGDTVSTTRGGLGVTGIFPLWKAAQSETAIKAMVRIGDRIAGAGSLYALIQGVFQHAYYELHAHLSPPYVHVDGNTREILGPPQELRNEPVLESTADKPDENVIASYLTKPQVFFGVPPACNVLWPSVWNQFSFNENFARQPTRTYVGDTHTFDLLTGRKGKRPGADEAISAVAINALTVAYPPEIDDRMTQRINGKGDQHSNYHDLLMYAEEFFKGPVYYNHEVPALFTYIAEELGDTASDRRLLKKYARYEHFRMRYSHRNGGVQMPLNPYVVQGFPIVVMDTEDSNVHVFAYCTQVQHTLSKTDMSTSVAFTFGQTFDDFFENLIEDRLYYGETTQSRAQSTLFDPQTSRIMAPQLPIKELRDRFQKFVHARDYYRSVLWQNEPLQGKDPVAFNWHDVIGIPRRNKVEDVDVDAGNNSNALTNEVTGEAPVYVVKDKFKRFRDNTSDGFRYASRPITTLDEWIDANGGVRQGKRGTHHPTQGKGAPYWVKILDLTPGPGQDPGRTTDGSACGPADVDTRKNWEARFLRFREKVYGARKAYKA